MRIAARVAHTRNGPVVTIVDDVPNDCGPGEYVILEEREGKYTEVGEFGKDIDTRTDSSVR